MLRYTCLYLLSCWGIASVSAMQATHLPDLTMPSSAEFAVRDEVSAIVDMKSGVDANGHVFVEPMRRQTTAGSWGSRGTRTAPQRRKTVAAGGPRGKSKRPRKASRQTRKRKAKEIAAEKAAAEKAVAERAAAQKAAAIKAAAENNVIVDVEVGGLKHEEGTSWSGLPEYDRPEYKIAERLTASNVWEPCVGQQGDPHNCWHGNAVGFDKEPGESGMLDASVQNLDYKNLAVETMFKCDRGGRSSINLRIYRLLEATIRIFVNHRLWKTERAIGSWVLPSSSESMTVRVEMVPNSKKFARATIKLAARNVKQSFDTCMTSKMAHADCLEELGGDGAEDGLRLRSDPSLQLACFQKPEPSCAQPTDVCDRWRCCLSKDTRALLKDIILAASKPKQAKTPELLMVRTSDSNSHSECVDPSHSDPESWDCECLEEWMARCPDTDSNRPGCLQGIMCAVPEVCKDWKMENCGKDKQVVDLSTSFTQRANQNQSAIHNAERKQRTQVTTDGADNDVLGDGLDGTVQGKCAAQ